MNKIIALVDASVYAQSVCQHAAWLSSRTGMPVELLHVLGRRDAPENPDLSGSIALGARSTLLAELATLDEQRSKLIARRGRAILDDARAILSDAGINEITTRLRHGDLLETVTEQEGDAGMIVIGKRGEAADFARGHLGSNLERIVRASHKPVLVASRAFKPLSKVLVAYDGGASAMKAVEHVAHSPIYAGLEIHVVTVGKETPEVRERLGGAQAMLREAGVAAQIYILPGQPEATLGELVEKAHFDMLVMGAYGHNRIRNLLIGSTTTEMIRSCKIPIILLR